METVLFSCNLVQCSGINRPSLSINPNNQKNQQIIKSINTLINYKAFNFYYFRYGAVETPNQLAFINQSIQAKIP